MYRAIWCNLDEGPSSRAAMQTPGSKRGDAAPASTAVSGNSLANGRSRSTCLLISRQVAGVVGCESPCGERNRESELTGLQLLVERNPNAWPCASRPRLERHLDVLDVRCGTSKKTLKSGVCRWAACGLRRLNMALRELQSLQLHAADSHTPGAVWV